MSNSWASTWGGFLVGGFLSHRHYTGLPRWSTLPKIGSDFHRLPQPGPPPGAKYAIMPHRTRLLAGLLVCLVSIAPLSSAASSDTEFAFFHENVLGTSLELRVHAESRAAAESAEDRVLHEIDRLAAIFNGYDPASELSRWQDRRAPSPKVSAELFEVLEHSDSWIRKTDGSFDPRAEALTRLWSSCAQQDRLPTGDELASARALMGPPAWKLDTAARAADAPFGLPDQLEWNRQGLHRRPGLRGGSGK